MQILPVNQSVNTADAHQIFIRAYQAVKLQAVLLACQTQLAAERCQLRFAAEALLTVLVYVKQSKLT